MGGVAKGVTGLCPSVLLPDAGLVETTSFPSTHSLEIPLTLVEERFPAGKLMSAAILSRSGAFHLLRIPHES